MQKKPNRKPIPARAKSSFLIIQKLTILLFSFLILSACSDNNGSVIDAGATGSKDADPGDYSDASWPIRDGGSPKWAPWPPMTGDAGLFYTWTLEGNSPDQSKCLAAGILELSLSLLSPDMKESWTSPDLTAECSAGRAELGNDAGLFPGRYRYRIDIFRLDGGTLLNHPTGEIELSAGIKNKAAHVNISKAQQQLPGT